jgi:phage shock protein C
MTRSTKEETVGSYRRTFRVNREERKMLGVCAGIADHFNVDVTLVRVAVAVATIMTFPLVLFAYLLLAMIAKPGGGRRRAEGAYGEVPRLSPASVEATRERMRDLDARMQAIESYVTSSNTALAREIDELR